MGERRHIMAVNVGGTMLAMKHASPHLQSGGAIVLMGSVQPDIGTDGHTDYHTSKGAVLGLMRAACGTGHAGKRGLARLGRYRLYRPRAGNPARRARGPARCRVCASA